MSAPPSAPAPPAAYLSSAALALGLIGMVATWLVFGAARFHANLVLWFLLLLSVALGALFLVGLEHLTGARWSVPLRRAPERVASLLPPLAPVALLALAALPALYPWAKPGAHLPPLVAGKSAWLNVPFFTLRLLLCLAAWLLSYRVLVGASLAQDASGDPALTLRMRRFAPFFMILFGFSVTVVAFDWISSLEPEWYSDILGVYLFAGVFCSGLAASALAALRMRREGRLPGVGPDHLYNLGGFMFAFTVFWSYIAFAQYLLMWYANIPEEVYWYEKRLHGGWAGVTAALVAVHFLAPFFALASRDAKRSPGRLAAAAGMLLVGHLLDLYWLIFPSVAAAPLLSWPELSFALFFLGSASAAFERALKAGADMPAGDPFLAEGLAFRL